VGAHVVGSAASEIVRVAQAFLRQGATATDIAEPSLAVAELGHQPQCDLEELLHGPEIVESLDDAVEVECDVLVDHDVPEPGRGIVAEPLAIPRGGRPESRFRAVRRTASREPRRYDRQGFVEPST
jgi:hypothetical protein